MWKLGIFKGYKIRYTNIKDYGIAMVPIDATDFPYFGSPRMINGEKVVSYDFGDAILAAIKPFRFESIKLI